ncbi:MAG TPA: alpha/beta hydrolase [Acidimicrobiales bacterium]|nr:alpha/beta hydrolase [Acidimicrobiales bacterium]
MVDAPKIPGAEQQFIEANGVVLSVYTTDQDKSAEGSIPPLLLLHGFPELAYSWRKQVLPLSELGCQIIVPDQRGYGSSSTPDPVGEYDIHHLTGDLIGLMDRLEIATCIVVGHDWGGIIAWQMPLLHRDRIAGVVGVNTPFMARFPARPTDVFRSMFGENHYIVRFQEPEVADRFLLDNIETVLPILARKGLSPEMLAGLRSPLDFSEVPSGLQNALSGGDTGFVESAGFSGDLPGQPLMSDEEMRVYIDIFRRTGFTGGINWYRNMDRNWETTPQLDGARIDGIPCLMITAEWDPYLPPTLANGMEDVIGDLETYMIPECGHWTQQDKPEDLNRLICDWITRKFG